jgi:hypothetical protein
MAKKVGEMIDRPGDSLVLSLLLAMSLIIVPTNQDVSFTPLIQAIYRNWFLDPEIAEARGIERH